MRQVDRAHDDAPLHPALVTRAAAATRSPGVAYASRRRPRASGQRRKTAVPCASNARRTRLLTPGVHTPGRARVSAGKRRGLASGHHGERGTARASSARCKTPRPGRSRDHEMAPRRGEHVGPSHPAANAGLARQGGAFQAPVGRSRTCGGAARRGSSRATAGSHRRPSPGKRLNRTSTGWRSLQATRSRWSADRSGARS